MGLSPESVESDRSDRIELDFRTLSWCSDSCRIDWHEEKKHICEFFSQTTSTVSENKPKRGSRVKK